MFWTMVKHILYWLFFSLLIVTFFSCQKKKEETISSVNGDLAKVLQEVPEGFPNIEFPDDNQFTLARWRLGKKLFYDPILSKDSTISCASCHKLDLAFSDDVAFSPGVNNAPGIRNAPTLTNIAYSPYLLREGTLPTLEFQVLVPIQEENEFNHNILDIVEKLSKNPKYIKMSDEAYSRSLDPFVITRSIATFERTLLSGDSRYDKFSYKGENSLTSEEKEGMELFFSDKTSCYSCHSGINFTNYAFENNGLYTNYADPGKYKITGDTSDLAKFKVATLRNVELTAPYMHDGFIETLEEVITHYNNGGKNHTNQSKLIRPLNLTDTEKDQLLLFLKTLTDYTFINKAYLAP